MKPKNLPPLDINQRYSVNEACDYLRISRAHLYKQINTGALPTIPDGKRTFIPGAAIAARSRIPDEAA
jgi:excisionase family DNA binding protein